MKLILLSFSLLGVAAIDAAHVVKREAGKQRDNTEPSQCECTESKGEIHCIRCGMHNCKTVPSCDNRITANELKMNNFIKCKSPCKCMASYGAHVLCEGQLKGQDDWTTVEDCSGYSEYSYCDAHGCIKVSDGYCFCRTGFCLKCSSNGCKQTKNCEGRTSTGPKPQIRCHYCDRSGCDEVPCLPQCSDDSADALVNEKCDFAHDGTGVEICGKDYCNEVSTCNRFVSCKCDMANDTYTKCYGYKKGTHTCRTLGKCSHVVADIVKAAWHPNHSTCECPFGGGLCKNCNFLGRCMYVKECGLGDH